MAERVTAGTTSHTIDLFLQDSSSATGGGLTGLTHSTSGLTAYYRKGGTGASTAITLATQTATGAWTSGGFAEVDATNMPGVYRLDLPNAVIDSAGYATVYLQGATNLLQTALRIDCTPVPAAVQTIATNAVDADALASDAAEEITADIMGHTITRGAAGSVERAFWQASKAQASAVGEVTGTPTASAFDTDLTAVTGAFDHLLIVFTSGSLEGEARPIDTYASTNGRITLQEALTAAPSAADEFLIVPSHVHKISDIQNGLATSAALAVVDGIVDQLKTRSGYTMSILAGAISNAQNAAEAYTITLDGTAYGVTYSGLDSSGNRTGATLTET